MKAAAITPSTIRFASRSIRWTSGSNPSGRTPTSRLPSSAFLRIRRTWFGISVPSFAKSQ
jgi:hypothetical protein